MGVLRRLGLQHVVVLVIVGAVASGCSSSDPQASRSTTSTAPPTTTTGGTTTSTAGPSSSTTPTTTVDDVKAEVVAGFDAAFKAYLAGVYDPAHLDRASIEATYAAGPLRDTTLQDLQRLATNGWMGRPTPENQEYYVVESVEVAAGSPPTRAVLKDCQVSDSVIFVPNDPANPNDDIIVNNQIESFEIQWDMVLEDGRWKRLQDQNLNRWEGKNGCPPKPS